MGKKEFIKKLRHGLSWTFTGGEIADILTDYEGFFLSGGGEGKDEAQICAELGDPAVIARELAETMGKKKRITARIKLRIVSAATLFILAVIVPFAPIPYGGADIALFCIIVLTAFAVALWFTLGGTLGKLPPTLRVSGKKRKWILAVGHILTIAVAAICFCGALNADLFLGKNINSADAVFSDAVFRFNVIQYMNMFLLTLCASAAAALCVTVFSVYGFYRRTPQFYTLAIHALGLVAFLYAIFLVFADLTDPTNLIAGLMRTLIIYGYAALLTGLSSFYIHAIQKRRAK